MKKLLAEVQAIQDCYAALSNLDQEGQERVVGYLISILDLEPPSAPPGGDEDEDGMDEEDEDLEDE